MAHLPLLSPTALAVIGVFEWLAKKSKDTAKGSPGKGEDVNRMAPPSLRPGPSHPPAGTENPGRESEWAYL